LHLAGCKKVQQILTNPGVLERFLDDDAALIEIRSVFARLYSLDRSEPARNIERGADDTIFDSTIASAVKDPHLYVMKPQREGGGNNVYNLGIAQALQTMSDDELSCFILMQRISSAGQRAKLLRDGLYTEV
jgi:hypothetical protein